MSEVEKTAKFIRHSIEYTIWIIVLFLALEFFGLAYFLAPMDSTDSPEKRSGLSIKIDNMTGCHYLYRGSLTPRMDETGKQICDNT